MVTETTYEGESRLYVRNNLVVPVFFFKYEFEEYL